MKVLRVSHTATVSMYRERDRQIAALGDVKFELITPTTWNHLGGRDDGAEERFGVTKVRTFITGSIPLFSFAPLPIITKLRHFSPDIVDIHEEPYSVSAFELVYLARLFAPKAACLFYSAQNINKRYPLPFQWSEQFVYSHSRGAYPCSEGVRQVLLAKGFKNACPVIPLGVDTEQFSPGASPLSLPEFANTGPKLDIQDGWN